MFNISITSVKLADNTHAGILDAFGKKYSLPLWLVSLWIIFFGWPALLVPLNPPPLESELTHFHAKILRVSDWQPNLTVILASGKQRDFRFPTPLNSIWSWKTRFSALLDFEEARLVGCDAEIYGADLRYVWSRTFKVWKIDCKPQPVSYERVVTEFRIVTKISETAPWFGGIVAGFFAVLTFVKAWKKKWARSPRGCFLPIFWNCRCSGECRDNPIDTLGIVVGIAQATWGGASLILGNVDALVKLLAGAGLITSAVGLYDNYSSISADLSIGMPPTLSDVSGAFGNAPRWWARV